MRQTERGARYVIYDDFLSGDQFDQAARLLERSGLSETQSVISPSLDGPARRSRGMSFAASIGDGRLSGRPPVFDQVAQAVHQETLLFGAPATDWDKITFTFWQYPAGSRLGWHNDAGRGRRGEFILYLHRTWDISWGGELMLIDRDPRTILPANDSPTGHFPEPEPEVRLREILCRCEISPIAILPRSNRLVLVQADTIHTVRRVDHTAGDNKRSTLTGFVYRDDAINSDSAPPKYSVSTMLITEVRK